MTTETLTHCQVCGRPIKAKTGAIAHHGYKRPHRNSGWQTASCYGARHVPYEMGHDALDLAIISCANHLAAVVKARDELISSPPATMTYTRTDAYHRVTFSAEHARPEGYDTAKAAEHGSYTPNTYDGCWVSRHWDLKRNISGTTETLKYLTERRAAWVAPTPAKE